MVKQILNRIKFTLASILLLLSASSVWLPNTAHASGEAFTGGTNINDALVGRPQETDLQISGSGDDTLYVTLQVGSGTLQMGNAASLNYTKVDSNFLQFSGSRSDINTDLADLTYTPSQAGTETITISLGSSANEVYNPANQHVYVLGGSTDWPTARSNASASTLGGVDGYLANITSADEENYLNSWKLANYWLGGNDNVEGVWEWADGSESGDQFWQGDDEGEAVDDSFTNWLGGNPDNHLGNEDCLMKYDIGYWNDAPCYVEYSPLIEYGDDEDLPEVTFKSFTVTSTLVTQEISSCAELMLADQVDYPGFDDIILTDDIDCQDTEVHALFKNDTGFHANFDGQGHAISNLTYEDDSYGNGLFAYVNEGASISNLYLNNVTIDTWGWSGALAGENYGTIENVHATNVTIFADYDAVGGLVGYHDGADVNDVSVIGNITAGEDSSETGGIFGYFQDGTLSNCSFRGNVDGEYEVGGVVGENEEDIVITRCYSAGSVNASDEDAGGILGEPESDMAELDQVFSTATITAGEAAGGLVGYANGGVTITNSYATGSVSAEDDAGGLIGNGYSDASIIQSYSVGSVNDSGESEDGDQFGALVGDRDDTSFTDVFWDNETASQENACGDAQVCDEGTFGKTTDEMKTEATFTEIDEPWDFEGVWQINPAYNSGYPCLRWSEDSCTSDLDKDGISDSDERAAPNNGDANDDGTADFEQSNIASLVNEITGKYVTLEADNSCSINSTSISEESTEHKDTAYKYSLGLMNFSLQCQPGATVSIKQYFYSDVNADSVIARKYNTANHTYTTISGATITNTSIGGQSLLKVVYLITDNGALDEDQDDGIIVDPSGPATLEVSAPDTGFGGSY